MRLTLKLAALPLVLALVAPAAARSAGAPATQVIVRFAPGTDARERADARAGADVERDVALPLPNTELVDPQPGVGVAEAVAELERDPGVLYAEPDAARDAFAVPNDASFPLEWGLQSTGQAVRGQGGTPGADVHAPAAWDVTTGSRAVVTGIIDSGADLTHPDLAANLWVNPGEAGALATNGRDDDSNGFVDDVNGWNFADRNARPTDAQGHGTHVAGTVGAQGGNAIGVTGVAQASSLMVLRALDAQGNGRVSDVVLAYAYAARNGARVVNLSFGGSATSATELAALRAASGVLFVAAAGNDGADNDTSASYPCEYDLPNVVCVAASDRNDALASFSNYGAQSVDLAAPGVAIFSTYTAGRYTYMSGTSMAAPHVSGVAALALSREPRLTVAQLRDVLLSTADPIPALQGRTVTGGRVDAAGAVAAAGGVTAPGTTVAAVPTPAPVTPIPAGEPLPAPPPPPPLAAADRTAPRLTVVAARALRVRSLLARGLRTTLTCSEACRFSATLTLDVRTARRLHLRTRRLAVASGALTAERRRVLVLRIAGTARTRLRAGRRGRATLRVEATDAAGNRRVRTQAVTLRS